MEITLPYAPSGWRETLFTYRASPYRSRWAARYRLRRIVVRSGERLVAQPNVGTEA